MKRTLLLSASTLIFLLAVLPVYAQTSEEPPPKWSLGFGYTGLAQIHEDTTIAYPLGFYAEAAMMMGAVESGRVRLGKSGHLLISATYHAKEEYGITTSFTGLLGGIRFTSEKPDLLTTHLSLQVGMERSSVSGTLSIPGITTIDLDETLTGAAFQIEGGFMVPINPDAFAKLSGAFRASGYGDGSELQSTTALIWSVGVGMTL